MPRALSCLAHRGPDDQGVNCCDLGQSQIVLGHTRLSIIDLSSGGHQPMYRERPHRGQDQAAQSRCTMVYNGEIYNYRELRDELRTLGHDFASDSDSEVLLAAWVEWGRAALPRLKGMFALAIVDEAQARITLARDAFGIKPLAFSFDSGWFAFASEVRALNELIDRAPELNVQQAYEYLVFGGYDDSDATFFRGVRQLLPGHVLTFDARAGKIASIDRWWWPSVEPAATESFEAAAERIRETFLANVRLHLRSDVPLGAALSGGIDSSAIVCAMRHVEPDMPLHTFTFVAPGSEVDEEHWADQVNAQVGAIPHKVAARPEELADDLADLIRTQGEPFGSTSIYAQYRVFKLARDSGITVTLEGQGADELFGGYLGYPGPILRGLIERGHWIDAARFASEWSKGPGRSRRLALLALGNQLAPRSLRGLALAAIGRSQEPRWLNLRALDAAGVRRSETMLPEEFDVPGRRLAATLRGALVRRGLPALLRHGDRNSMRWSIESRVPFLTPDLAEFALSLPESYLVSRNGETKSVLRRALRGIVPDAILQRRDKIGFATPEREWLRTIAPRARGWLMHDLKLPFLDQRRALAEFDAIVAGRKTFTWQVWRWINFTQWYRTFFA
jgi:asparagine synthase (glutamine-hydrolysing)